jgi:hypothetical protein
MAVHFGSIAGVSSKLRANASSAHELFLSPQQKTPRIIRPDGYVVEPSAIQGAFMELTLY